MLIRVSGPAVVTGDAGDPLPPAALAELDGATSEDVCSNYLYEESLADLALTGGAVKLVRDAATGEFRVVTEYGAGGKLKPAVVKQLVAATTAR